MSDVLTELADALDRDNEASIIEMSSAVSETIQERKQEHLAYQNVALRVRKQTDADTSLESTATDVVNQGSLAAEAHAELGIRMAEYLQGDVSGSKASSLARKAADAHSQFEQGAEELRQADTVSIGPVLALYGPNSITVPVGEEPSDQYEIRNLGDEPTTGVTASIRTSLDLQAKPAEFDAIAPGSSAAFSASGEVKDMSRETVSIRARTEDNADELSVEVQALSKTDYLEEARSYLGGLIDVLDSQSKEDSSGKGSKSGNSKSPGLLNQVETASKRLQKIQRSLETGKHKRQKQTNNKISSVIENLGAILNHVDAKSGKSIPASQAAKASASIESAIDNLSSARSAEI